MKINLDEEVLDSEDLPFRQAVIGIIINKNKKFLIVQMLDYGENDWRFAGGGIDDGEDAQKALLRELEEELGTSEFKILKKSKIINEYDWPEKVIVDRYKKEGKLFRGQQQTQYLVEFTGENNSLKPAPEELKAIKWVSYSELKDHFNFPDQWEKAEIALQDLLG